MRADLFHDRDGLLDIGIVADLICKRDVAPTCVEV